MVVEEWFEIFGTLFQAVYLIEETARIHGVF
jgi:hypothetical protein